MKTFRTIIVTMIFAFLAVSCGNAPVVVNGKVTSFDKTSGILVIDVNDRDKKPTGQQMTLTANDKTEIGKSPKSGDDVRIAYTESGGTKTATRIMNFTQEKELKESKKGH